MSLTLFGGDLGHRADGRFHPIRRCLGILGRHPPVQEHVGDAVALQVGLGVIVDGLDEMVQERGMLGVVGPDIVLDILALLTVPVPDVVHGRLGQTEVLLYSQLFSLGVNPTGSRPAQSSIAFLMWCPSWTWASSWPS